ncbi:MAG: methyl-accepting chemotaxis protein, partial [Anaerolineae bacterium]|nr:methyl-accepting chemotaxis protein [Anaerolineae bacterium]
MNEIIKESLIMATLLLAACSFVWLVIRFIVGTGIILKLGTVTLVAIFVDVELGFVLGKIGLDIWPVVILYTVGITTTTLLLYIMFRLVVMPVQELISVAQQIAKGDLSQTFAHQSSDEIGQLADVLRQTVNYQRGIATSAAELALGNVNTAIVAHSDMDVAGNAFLKMVAYQQEMARAADRLAEGDIAVTVQPQSKEDMLGSAFARMVTYQQTMAEAAGQLARGDVKVNVQPQSEHDVLGNAFAQMIIYQKNIAEAAGHLAGGDIAVAVTPQSPQDQLGNAFTQMIIYQQAMAEAASKLAMGDMSTKIQPQSEQDRLGQAFAQMIAYQQQIFDAAFRMSQGDLSVTVNPQNADDALGNAFARMIANLRELVGQVQRSASEVATAAQQITQASEQSAAATGQVAGTMQQISRGASQQTERMTQTAAMVQQVAHAIEGVARGAQEQSVAVTQASDVTTNITEAVNQVVTSARAGADDATRTAQTAQASAHTIEATIRGMQAIKQTQDEARSKVAEMGVRAEEIGMIVVAIEKIADQTNLLALNAAIEAARAGEHGKGFAVVADEVRRLAENAGNATQEIVALVKGIQKSVDEAIKAMETGAVEVDSGVTRSREAGQALGEILGAVNLVNQQMTGIAHAAQQMNVATQEMVNAVETVSAVVEE